MSQFCRNPLCVQLDMEFVFVVRFALQISQSQSAMRAIRYGAGSRAIVT